MLAVLLMNPKATTDAEAERLLLDVVSWDLCDHLCKNLFLKMKSRDIFIAKWIQEPLMRQQKRLFVIMKILFPDFSQSSGNRLFYLLPPIIP